jgi:hypothetical protein
MRLPLNEGRVGDREGRHSFSGRPENCRATPPRRRSGVRKVVGGIGWLFGGPRDWAAVGSIRRGISLIGDLARNARHEPSSRGRVFVRDDRALDLEVTAFSHGISVAALRARLEVRRRETARLAYVMFGLGVLCLVFWLHAALRAPLTSARLMLAVDFLPFGALFFLCAFYQALLNYQIRSGRRTGWRAYLIADDGILPR